MFSGPLLYYGEMSVLNLFESRPSPTVVALFNDRGDPLLEIKYPYMGLIAVEDRRCIAGLMRACIPFDVWNVAYLFFP